MSMAAPPPIPGEPVDPPPRETEQIAAAIEDRSWQAATVYRATQRFNGAHGLLLAAGTTYYIFLAVFSLLALAFGVVALVGATRISDVLSTALAEALPGLVGEGGLDASRLRLIGQSTSVLGFVLFIYAGAAMMTATSSALHILFGAPKDPRNFFVMKLRLLGWLVLLAPLLVLSFTPSLMVSQVADPFLELIGLGGAGWAEALMYLGAYGISLGLSFIVIYLLLGHLGGIKPDRRPRLIGAGIGAVGTEVLRLGMATVVSWALARPQYGAFAVPIAVMLVLFLQTLMLYYAAALTAALAERTGGEAPAEMTAEIPRQRPAAEAVSEPAAPEAALRRD